MFVRVKFGINAGKIIDIRPEEARELLKAGRAVDPRLEKKRPIETEAPAPTPNPSASSSRKRRLFRSN